MSEFNELTADQMSSSESEHGIVGALLLDNSAFDRIADRLKPEHFFNHDLKIVFTEISRQLSVGKAVDVVTVFEGLEGQISLQTLNAYAQYVPSAANIHRYVETVIDRSKSRDLLSVSGRVSELATQHHVPINDRIEDAQAQLARLIDDTPRDEWVGAYEGMMAHTSVIEDRADGRIKSMPTGLYDLDDMLDGGLRDGSLIVVGARPSMGKTALAMTIGLNMSQDYSVGFLSMEMPHQELRDRQIAMLGRIDLSKVIRPKKDGGIAWDRVIDGTEKARTLNFYASDQSGLNINQVKSKARNLKRLKGLNVLIVDYLGLMEGLDKKQQRTYQLEEITRGLKALAKDLSICVICLAQLNRKVEERVDQSPTLADLRDSGAIEQDADVIMFITRPIRSKPSLGDEWKYYAQLDIAKARQGRVGRISLSYLGEQVRFDSWSGPAPTSQAKFKREAP